MPLAPVGFISLTLESLRVLIANTPAFRTWVGGANGVASVDQVKDRIFLFEASRPDGTTYTVDELNQLRPFVVLRRFMLKTPTGDLRSGGEPIKAERHSNVGYQHTSKWFVDFEDKVPPEDLNNIVDAERRFLNNVGQTIEGIENLTGDTSYITSDEATAGICGLGVQMMTVHLPAHRTAADELGTQGDAWKETWMFVVAL
jgi:hypothetical protein